MKTEFIEAIIGGGLIGAAVTLLLLFNGRVAGISGIMGGVVTRVRSEWSWRASFLLGLVVGGLVLRGLAPTSFENASGRSLTAVAIAGLLVGFGTRLGNGCTSGHGICGISRLSMRSILATLTFMIFGMLTVAFVRYALGGNV